MGRLVCEHAPVSPPFLEEIGGRHLDIGPANTYLFAGRLLSSSFVHRSHPANMYLPSPWLGVCLLVKQEYIEMR